MNRTKELDEDIMVRSSLPDNMEYIDGSTVLYNSSHSEGLEMFDIVSSAINIGDYKRQGNAFIGFKARIRDVSLAEGNNQLVTWVKITQNNEALCYDASAFVMK